MPAWFIFDVETDVQSEVDPSQLARVVKDIPADKLKSTVFWQEGWADWRPLAEIPELMEFRKVTPPPPPRKAPQPPPRPEKPIAKEPEPPPLQQIPVTAKIPEPVPVQQIPVAAKAPEERRRTPREKVRFRVMFTWDDVVFRTFSKDLSLHGLRVEHPVPDSMMNRQVQCFISSPDMKSAVRFKATLIGESPDRLRFRFIDEDSHAQGVLEEWFETIRKTRRAA